MDAVVSKALHYFRRDPEDPSAALSLCHALSRAGLLPDSLGQDRGHLLKCDLDNLGNATAHLEIGPVKLLLFHKTVVGVQTEGQKAVINPEWNTVTTRKRIREWPHAIHVRDLAPGENFDDLIRFRPA